MNDRVAIVTGASSGIGEATARKLRQLGYQVYAAARRLDRLAPLAEVGIRPAQVDVTDDASLVSLVDRVLAEAGRVDVLVNNAGYGSFGSVEEVPLEEARRQFDVNVFGLARLSQLVLPQMRRQGHGRIVNISSVGGRIHEPLGGWYHATKFAVEGLSDSMRMELAPLGIDVVVIQPGAIATEWSAIASQHLLATSGHGPYADQALRAATFFDADAEGQASPPTVVANAVAKAVSARRPRTRYAVGRGATLILAARRILTDRGFDRFINVTLRTLAWVAARQNARRDAQRDAGQRPLARPGS